MKNILFVFLLFNLVKPVFAQESRVYDNEVVKSKILKMDRKFAVYLPPGYEISNRSYPILYLLHGSGDDQTGWVQFGEVQALTDQAIKNGTATPMVIIMPDANTGRQGYFNDIKGDWNYEDFFFKELMPFVEKKYRIRAEKHYRAVAGLSMGGGGSFIYALHHPELFSSACPLSAYIGPLNLEEMKKRMSKNLDGLSDSIILKYYRRHSALELVNSMPDSSKKLVKWFIDDGDDDFLYEGNCLIHIAMRKRDIPHEFRVRDGGHTWTYWRASLPVVLSFISDTFHQ